MPASLSRALVLAGAVAGAVLPAPAPAQQTPAPVAPYVGGGTGIGGLSAVFPNICGDVNGQQFAVALDLRAGVRVGRVGVEARTGFADAPDIYDCLALPSSTRVETPFESEALVTTDLRVRAPLPLLPLTAAVGAGWAWPQELPYVVAGVDSWHGRRIRWGVEAEVVSARVPYRIRSVESDLPPADRAWEHAWKRSFFVKLGLEVPVR